VASDKEDDSRLLVGWLEAIIGCALCFCGVVLCYCVCRPSKAKPAATALDKERQTEIAKVAIQGADQISVSNSLIFRKSDKVKIQSDLGVEEAEVREVGGDHIVLAGGLRNTHPRGTVITNLSGAFSAVVPVVPNEHLQSSIMDTPRRKTTVQQIFHALNKEKAKTLSSASLFQFAQADGYTGNQHEWDDQVWPALQRKMPDGCTLENFEMMLNDRADNNPMYCADRDLELILNKIDKDHEYHGSMPRSHGQHGRH
jgi:hypothetical protein